MNIKVSPKTTVKITDPLEMVGFLRTNGTRCQFVSMLTVTEPKLKKNCPFKGVVKVSRRNGLINMDYNKAVRSRVAATLGVPVKDVEYENGETWFIHDTVTVDGEAKALPLVVNKNQPDGKKYLQYFPLKSKQTRYVLPNGETVTKEQLDPYFYARAEKPDFKPTTCVFKIESIKELRASGIIIQDKTAAVAETNLAPV